MYAIGAHVDAYNVSIAVGEPVRRTAEAQVQIKCQIEHPYKPEVGKAIAETFARVVLNIQNLSDAQLTLRGVAIRTKAGTVIESVNPTGAGVARLRMNDGTMFGDFIRTSMLSSVKAQGSLPLLSSRNRTITSATDLKVFTSFSVK